MLGEHVLREVDMGVSSREEEEEEEEEDSDRFLAEHWQPSGRPGPRGRKEEEEAEQEVQKGPLRLPQGEQGEGGGAAGGEGGQGGGGGAGGARLPAVLLAPGHSLGLTHRAPARLPGCRVLGEWHWDSTVLQNTALFQILPSSFCNSC